MTALKINKKVVLEAVFLIGIIALTLYSIFHEQDPAAIWACLRGADIRYLIGSIFLVLAFVLGESVILWWLFRTSGQKAKASHCCLYSFVGFFFSAITPSASGGQPMQLYFMKKDKLPLSVSTLILLIVTITYKMVLVVLGLAVLVIRPPVVMHYLNPILFWCYLGIILNVICVWVMLALVFHPDWMYRMVAAMIDLVTRIFHWKRGIKLRERLDGAMEKYSQAAAFFKSHKIIVLQVLVITFLQRGCLFLVTVAACRSLVWLPWPFWPPLGRRPSNPGCDAVFSTSTFSLPMGNGGKYRTHRIITGNDIGCGRYASVSWRSRNIRGIVLKNIYTIMWRNFGTSGIDR